MASLLPNGKQQFSSAAGPMVGGKVYTYDAGTLVPRVTYADAAGTVPNTNPVILDARGEATVFWVGAYKVELRDALDNLIWTIDNVRERWSVLEGSGGSSIVGFIQSGAEAVARTAQDKMRERVSVKDFGAVGDGVTDDTVAVQAAINFVSTNRIGTLYCPVGTYLGNWTVKSDVVFIGDGENATIFKSATDAPVFTTQTAVATVRIGWVFCRITGSAAHTVNGDGIRLGTTTAATFVDQINLYGVTITGVGRYGLYAFGTSTSGPFVQRLHVDKCNITSNINGRGLYLLGAVLETSVRDSSIDKNGPTSGAIANAEIAINGTAIPQRVLFSNVAFNHFNALNAGNPGTALKIAGAQQVTLDTCDLESANPFVDISQGLTRGIVLRNCSLATNFAVTKAINISDCRGVLVESCEFAGGTVAGQIGIDMSGSTWSRCLGVEERGNVYRTYYTVPLKYPTTPLRVTYGGIAATNLYQIQDTHDAAAVTDDLDTVYGPVVQQNVTGAVDNGAGLIRLTVVAHTLTTGDSVRVEDVGGVAAATGQWVVTVIDANTLDLQGSVFAGPYASVGRLILASTVGLDAGRTITLRTFNSGRDIVVKHNTGNILLNGAADVTLTTNAATLTLSWDASQSKWIERGRCIV